MKRACLWLGWALSAACGGGASIAEHDLFLELRASAAEVELGRAFTLEVVRVWRKDLVPEAWKDEALAPLVVRELGIERREDGQRIEETRRLAAHAFALDALELRPTLRARPRQGGVERVVAAAPLVLRVRSALLPGASEVAELPGELLVPPRLWWRLVAAGLAALVASGWLVSRLRRQRAERRVAAPPQAPAAPGARALDGLQRLRARGCQDRAAVETCYVETAALVRGYVEERFTVKAAEMTTEELRRAEPMARALGPAQHGLLAEVLVRCDLVKFARQSPPEAERQLVLDSAERFVRETAAANGAPR